MTKITSPEQLPQMLAALSQQGFYGDIRITYRHGEVTRVVTEQSQVFNSPKGRTFNDDIRK